MSRLSELDEVRSALGAVNDGLFSAMRERPDLAGMGTTIVGVVFRSGSALVFNIGDSRAYIQISGRLARLTNDHVIDGHMLTQCIGGFAPRVLKPYATSFKITEPCRLLLCSDGLTDMLEDSDIQQILERQGSAAAEALINAALDAGGLDNITVVVLDLEPGPDRT
jgi:protein phosphatase